MCLSKKILYQYFLSFYSTWESFSSENILYLMCLYVICKTFYVFYFLYLYKTDNFDTIIKKPSFMFLCYDLFDSPFVYVAVFLLTW